MAEKVTIGNCTLYHGDCREVLPLLPPVDLVLTDPPYGIGADARAHQNSGNVQGHGNRRVAARTYEKTEWDNETPPRWLMELMREKGRHQIIFGGNYYDLPPTTCILVWDKKNGTNNFADCELAWTNLPMAVRKIEHLWNGFAREGNEERHDHPTQKPLRVIEWAISQAPNPTTVCDPFMGSGTTGVACARMGLQFVGIERERKYFDIACRRIEQAYAQPRLFEDAKVGAGETAVQGDMLLPANALGQATGAAVCARSPAPLGSASMPEKGKK